MADQRDGGISWTDTTWNPVRGCSRVSAGCGGAAGVGGCYAEKMAARFSGPGMVYEGLVRIGKNGPRWTGVVRLVPEHLDDPLRWRDWRPKIGRPRRIFVNSMSDLFHESLPFETIAAVFGVMAAATRHTFQVLTKRPARAAEFLAWAVKRGEDGLRLFADDPADWRIRQCMHVAARRAGVDMNADDRQNHGGKWPLPNVWIGVSVEDQATADERIPVLLALPAAVRFVSAEPLLGPVDLSQWLIGDNHHDRRRKDVSGVRGNRSVLDRSDGLRLETSPADSRQSHADATILEDDRGEARGPLSVGRLPNDHVLGRDASTQGVRASCRVDDGESGGRPAADADQSHQRPARGQPPGESGDGHSVAELHSRHSRAGAEAALATRVSEPVGETDGVVGGQHPGDGREDGAVADREDVRRDAVGGVSSRHADELGSRALDWIIIGGESGPGARPFDLAWMRSTIAQCKAASVPVFCKQLGAKPYESVSESTRGMGGIGLSLHDRAGADPSEWPESLRVRQFPGGAT